MKNILLIIIISLGLAPITKAQVITCVPCDQISMVVNVGSDTTSLSIYHAGQYLTHPQEHNIFSWEFTDNQGNIIFKDTIVDDSHCNFSHNFPSTKDTRVNTLIKHVRTDRFAVERPRRQHETTHLQRFVFLGFDKEAVPAS